MKTDTFTPLKALFKKKKERKREKTRRRKRKRNHYRTHPSIKKNNPKKSKINKYSLRKLSVPVGLTSIADTFH